LLVFVVVNFSMYKLTHLSEISQNIKKL